MLERKIRIVIDKKSLLLADENVDIRKVIIKNLNNFQKYKSISDQKIKSNFFSKSFLILDMFRGYFII